MTQLTPPSLTTKTLQRQEMRNTDPAAQLVSAGENQITCRFKTKLPSGYRVPSTEIAVPANLTRYGLSQVINHLLGLEDTVPFDFLVNGELIRLSLGKLLLSQNLSAERVLEVEYILAVAPPEVKQKLPHDDWIGAVDGSRDEVILSGCYDGMLRVWNGSGELLSSTPAHRGPVSTLVGLAGAAQPLILSGGKLDHVIRLLQIASKAAHASTLAVYRGHAGSVLGVSPAPSGDTFVSASQDKTLRIWPTGDEALLELREQKPPNGPSAKKKQKLQTGAAVDGSGSMEVECTAEFQGHSDAVTSVAWSADGIYSGSMDHTVRKWDAETGINVDTYNDRKAISCLAAPGRDRCLVAFAGAARALHVWDPRRRQAEDMGVVSLVSHKSHIHDVAWHPQSEHHLVTASLDKTLKLWDLRSPIPLHTLEGHTDQVLCASWWGPQRVVSGSADRTVRVFDLPVQQ